MRFVAIHDVMNKWSPPSISACPRCLMLNIQYADSCLSKIPTPNPTLDRLLPLVENLIQSVLHECDNIAQFEASISRTGAHLIIIYMGEQWVTFGNTVHWILTLLHWDHLDHLKSMILFSLSLCSPVQLAMTESTALEHKAQSLQSLFMLREKSCRFFFCTIFSINTPAFFLLLGGYRGGRGSQEKTGG